MEAAIMSQANLSEVLFKPASNTLKRQRWFVVLITARSRPYNLPWMVKPFPTGIAW
jgi:hypothetical protein